MILINFQPREDEHQVPSLVKLNTFLKLLLSKGIAVLKYCQTCRDCLDWPYPHSNLPIVVLFLLEKKKNHCVLVGVSGSDRS